ncbi:hypothetical protein LCGC14_1256380 [marine sediment metagenome]|uniref:Uncharacterized protein n=1 Tax=marine sediment metagenome TaxID=412755 RepID=A0A0F9P5D6_9ZZZZ
MATHSDHPSIRDNGLADGCPRCKEHAEYPFEGLDDGNLESLIDRLASRADSRSVNEDNAMRVISKAVTMATVLWHRGWRPRS